MLLPTDEKSSTAVAVSRITEDRWQSPVQITVPAFKA